VLDAPNNSLPAEQRGRMLPPAGPGDRRGHVGHRLYVRLVADGIERAARHGYAAVVNTMEHERKVCRFGPVAARPGCDASSFRADRRGEERSRRCTVSLSAPTHSPLQGADVGWRRVAGRPTAHCWIWDMPPSTTLPVRSVYAARDRSGWRPVRERGRRYAGPGGGWSAASGYRRPGVGLASEVTAVFAATTTCHRPGPPWRGRPAGTDEVSVVGFDDIRSRVCDSALTLRGNFRRVALQGLELLYARSRSRTEPPPMVEPPVELVVRGSTAPRSAVTRDG